MTLACRFLDAEAFQACEMRRRLRSLTVVEAFGVGAMWFCPWLHDPKAPDAAARRAEKLAEVERHGRRLRFLSVHYWRDWALFRPPIIVLCPDGRPWCPDQASENGDGWTVSGETPPKLTVRPSIVTAGYHGWLTDGVFSDGIDGRG